MMTARSKFDFSFQVDSDENDQVYEILYENES